MLEQKHDHVLIAKCDQPTSLQPLSTHTSRLPLEKGITNHSPIPRVEFIRWIHPTQALSIHRNSYFICSESATASKETPLPPPFSLSKRAPKSGGASLPFSLSLSNVRKWIRKPDTLCYKNHSYLGNTLRIRLYLHTPGKLCTRLDRVYVHRLCIHSDNCSFTNPASTVHLWCSICGAVCVLGCTKNANSIILLLSFNDRQRVKIEIRYETTIDRYRSSVKYSLQLVN